MQHKKCMNSKLRKTYKFPPNITHAKYDTNIIFVYHIMAVTNDSLRQIKWSPLCFLKLSIRRRIVGKIVIYKVSTHVYKNANKFCLHIFKEG